MAQRFCSVGCEQLYDEEFPDIVEVTSFIPASNDNIHIVIQKNMKRMYSDEIAFVRGGTYSDINVYRLILNHLLELSKKIPSKLFDPQIKIEVNENSFSEVLKSMSRFGNLMQELL